MRRTFGLMHLRQLRRQPLRAALAIIAIAAGVTLTVAVLTARSSLDRSFNTYNDALGGGAPLRIASRYDHGGIDQSTLVAVEQVAGVESAVPLVVTVTEVDDQRGHTQLVAAIGADCRAAAIFGVDQCDPATIAQLDDTRPPLIGSGLRSIAGPGGVLRTDVGDRSLASAPVQRELDRLNSGRVAVYPLRVAQTLFARPGGLDAIYIVPRAGASLDALRSDLTAAVGPQNQVLSASDAGKSVTYVSNQLVPFLLLVSLFGLAVGGQLVFNTMSLSLEERRRELAIASAIGGTPATVMVGVLAEAGLLGLAGAALGICAGLVTSRPFVDNLSTYAERAAGVHLSVHPTVSIALIALAIGVLASMTAAFVPARRAARLDIAGELVDRVRRYDTSRRVRATRAFVYLALSATGLLAVWRGAREGGLESWQPPLLTAGLLITFVSTFRLGPALAPFAVRAASRVPALQRGPARVAVSNLLTETRRTSAVLTAVGAAVGMAFTLGGVSPGLVDGADSLGHDIAAGRVTVSTVRPNNTTSIDSRVSPDIQRELATLPGVAKLDQTYWASLDLPGVGQIALSSTDGGSPRHQLFRGVGANEALGRGQVLIGVGLARAKHLRPGDTFTIPGRFGKMSLVVGAIWEAPDDLGKSIYMPIDVFTRTVGTRPAQAIGLVPQTGVSTSQLAATARAARLADNLKVWDASELGPEYAQDLKRFLTPFWLLARGLLIVAFIATASTLLLSGVKRRAEHGLLAAVGMPPGDLGRMVLVEAGLLGVLGTASGLFGGLLSLMVFSSASTTFTGLSIPFHLNLSPLFVYGPIATALVLAGAALPAWRTSQLDPVVALRFE